VALIGGRNIGNQYFQIDPESQFADDDVFSAGPIAAKLSSTFDEYWNSALAIPAQALGHGERESAHAAAGRARAAHEVKQLNASGIDYVARAATGEPYAGMISGRLPLVWAQAQVLCDSPDKKDVENRPRTGHLMTRAVAKTAASVQSELLMVTPYLVPAADEMQILQDLRQRQVTVRILTNSLESTTDIAAFSGYMQFRVPLLENGVQLYEVRSLLGNTRGSGQTPSISRYGNYSLHGKLFVFDRQKLFIGSMNFDERSRHLNTEVGLIIDSAELAQQTATRFEAMAEPDNAYIPALREDRGGKRKALVWDTEEQGQPHEYTRESARSNWQRLEAKLLSLLPLKKEL
jgi:cardiolipin synthase C